MLGSFTGLLPLLVDRALSHELGFLPDKLTAQGEHAARWAHEQALLTRLFASSCPVVSFPSHSVVHAGALPWLTQRCDTVFVREPRPRILARVAADVASDPKLHWLLAQGQPPDPTRVFGLLHQHEEVLDQCDRTLDPPDAEPHRQALSLMQPLGLTTD